MIKCHPIWDGPSQRLVHHAVGLVGTNPATHLDDAVSTVGKRALKHPAASFQLAPGQDTFDGCSRSNCHSHIVRPKEDEYIMKARAIKQVNISPKLIADALVSIGTFALTYFALDFDPEVAAAISKVLGFLAGTIPSPGEVVVETTGPASDSLLPSKPVD
jgi:hypothetical protein